jgi:quinone-modifying oxidoreductase subunit QmoC
MEQEKIETPEAKLEKTKVETPAPQKDDSVIALPDLNFVNEIIKGGGESLKKCYQCATCSVVCNLAPDNNPFPRKEMIYAQWGFKDKLLPNPNIWLCHQCSDCTAYCPRGAKPGEVLNAVRKMSIEHYSVPRFLGKALGSPGSLVLLLAVPAVIFLIILAGLGHLNLESIRNDAGKIAYSALLPSYYIDGVFVPIFIFAVISLAIGICRYWKDMVRTSGMTPKGGLASTTIATIGEILSHERFEKCELTKMRKISHFLVFYSFIGLAITTAWAVLYLYGYEIMHAMGKTPYSWLLGPSPYPLTDPVKWVGNASALALLIGITLVVIYRLKNKEKTGSGGYYDWLFIYLVFSIVITGILAELFRLADIAILAYLIYFVHLVVVFFLIAYAPFSKMAHMVYRGTAMVFAKYSEKES